MTFELGRRTMGSSRLATIAAAAWLTSACHPDFDCKVMGTLPCPGYEAEARIEAGVSSETGVEAGVSTGEATTSNTVAPSSPSSASSSGTGTSETVIEVSSSTETSSSESTKAEVGCVPLTDDGCEGETPWCLGTTRADADGGSIVEPRCVECEEDSHCQWPYVPKDQGGICLGHACTACELATNRGCSADAPYCIGGAEPRPLGDAAVGQSSGPNVVDAGSTDETVQCVECLSETDCGGEKPACVGHVCVACDRDAQCTNASASRCDVTTHECAPCNAVGQCAHVADAPACDVTGGRCVACTREEQSACDDGALGFDYACVTIPEHPGYQTCSSEQRENSGQCIECVSDVQCLPGFKCVPETFGLGVGDAGALPTGKRYCMALEAELGDGKECGNNRPFIASVEGISEGGISGSYCRPRFATCAAYLTYGDGPDKVPDGQPGAGEVTCFDNASCGIPNVSDGYCVRFTATTNRCTYECASSDDCKGSSTCDFSSPPTGVLPGNGICSL